MLKKLFSLFAALLLTAGLWAIDNVAYIDANGQSQTANGVIEITNSSATLAAGWYVVNGTDVQTSKLVCNGEVHLILADGAKLTATAEKEESGIRVSGDGNSLAIYGQTAQSGQLIATGGDWGAGIGGRVGDSGSDIIINGGIVTATGGLNGAGIGGGSGNSGSDITINGGTVTATGRGCAAGIGGGINGSASNITINGGAVTANGDVDAAGIGGGLNGSASNIFVATSLVVKADNNNPPTTVIENDGSDLASSLAGKQYATVEAGGAKYFAKNNWNGASADSWSWLEMYQTNMKNVYMLDSVVFGGTGIYINTKEEDADALWFAEDKIGVRNGLDGIPLPYIPEPRKRDTVLYAPHRVAKPLQFNTLQAGDTIKLFFNISDSTLSTLIIGRPGSTALPTVFGEGVKGNKFMHNGQLIIRKGEKMYNAVGQEL